MTPAMFRPAAALLLPLALFTGEARAGEFSLKQSLAQHTASLRAEASQTEGTVTLHGYIVDSLSQAPDSLDPSGVPDQITVRESGQTARIEGGSFRLLGVPTGRRVTLMADFYNPSWPKVGGGFGVRETARASVTPTAGVAGASFEVPTMRPGRADAPPCPDTVTVRGFVVDSLGNGPNQLHPQGIPDRVVIRETGQAAHIVGGAYELSGVPTGATATLCFSAFNPSVPRPGGGFGMVQSVEVRVRLAESVGPVFEVPTAQLR